MTSTSTAESLREDANEPLVRPDDAHNQTLVANVHPRDWVNPKPEGRYNLVVIGGGTAGLVSAVGAAGLGAKVALVERHLLGGDCLNFGCVPSKALLRAAHVAAVVKGAGEYGVTGTAGAAVDFGRVMERMRALRAGISANDSVHRLTRLGVDVFIGSARFTARDRVAVGDATLEFARAVIATGGRATALPVPGLVEAGFLTNETVFSLTELPRRVVVIGAGPIGCELAQAFRRFGSEVTIISLDARLLPREDADAAAVLTRTFEREGIQLALGAKLTRVERRGSAKVVLYEREGAGGEAVGDEILVAVGRAPNVDGLDVDKAGVEVEKTGIRVDDHLNTTNSNVFAAGDICSPYKFTHAADAMARVVLQNALFFGRKKVSALVIPWATYTDPEIAHVGLYEQQARDAGHDVATYTVPMDEVDRAVLEGAAEGFARVHTERKSGKILGATMVAAHAGDMIGEMALAMTEGLSLASVARTIHPYPTQAEAWKRLGDQYMRTRLTPRVKSTLERLLRWRR